MSQTVNYTPIHTLRLPAIFPAGRWIVGPLDSPPFTPTLCILSDGRHKRPFLFSEVMVYREK